jgi:hypothetical protein
MVIGCIQGDHVIVSFVVFVLYSCYRFICGFCSLDHGVVCVFVPYIGSFSVVSCITTLQDSCSYLTIIHFLRMCDITMVLTF